MWQESITIAMWVIAVQYDRMHRKKIVFKHRGRCVPQMNTFQMRLDELLTQTYFNSYELLLRNLCYWQKSKVGFPLI